MVRAKEAKLDIFELKQLTIGMVADYIEEYAESLKPKENKPRKATQQDIQWLKGRL